MSYKSVKVILNDVFKDSPNVVDEILKTEGNIFRKQEVVNLFMKMKEDSPYKFSCKIIRVGCVVKTTNFCLTSISDNEADLTTAYMVGYEKAKDKYKPKWRKYPEEKPNKCGEYLCLRYDGFYAVYDFDSEDSFIDTHTCLIVTDKVTYWMPIPELEKSNETNR